MEEKVKNPQQKPGFIPFEEQHVIHPLKLLVVTVHQGQGDAIRNILNEYECAFCWMTSGLGMTFRESSFSNMSNHSKKVFVFAIVRADKANQIKKRLAERFAVSRAAQGIAYFIDLTSVAGVSMYRFLSNSRKVSKK